MNLKQILHGHAGTLLERPSAKAILSDAFNNDMPKINALMSAYDIGIVTTIQANFPLGTLARANAINKLIKQYSMLEDKATWAVDQWIAAIDGAVIREMQALIKGFRKQFMDIHVPDFPVVGLVDEIHIPDLVYTVRQFPLSGPGFAGNVHQIPDTLGGTAVLGNDYVGGADHHAVRKSSAAHL